MARNPGLKIDELLPIRNGQKTIKTSSSTKGLITLSFKELGSVDISAKFERAINRASQRIAIELKTALDAALLSGVWSTPGGTADIYDTGQLLESGTVTSDSTGITVAYSAPYASLIHFGGYIRPYGNVNSKVYLPARPWVQSVMNGGGPVPQFDFERYFTEEIKAEFSA